MNPRDRRVRHLRLTCQREEHARRGQTLLADALRTASLADEGRLVVIRSLALGRLSLQDSPAAWSLRLEQRVRAARTIAVRAETPEAATAEAVWFPNAVELWVALAARVARGIPCSEWFWLPAAAGWNPQLGAAPALRLAFQRLAATGGWPATFALARRLAREGSLLPLLRSLTPEDLDPWLPESPRPSPGSAPRNEPPGQPPEAPAPEGPRWPTDWAPIAAQFLAGFPTGDARLVWLAAAALSADSLVPPRARDARRLAEQALRSLPATGSPDGGVSRDGRPPAPETPPLRRSDGHDAEQSRPVLPPPPAHPDGELTGCGGLFFLVRLFERLGVAGWPDAGATAWRTLSLVLQRCQASPQDDLARLLPSAAAPAPAAFVLGALPWIESPRGPRLMARWLPGWRVLLDATGRLPLAAWPRETRLRAVSLPDRRPVGRTKSFPGALDPRLLALALGSHRLSRRMTGLGLKALVRRPARVAITDTHIDLHFRPAEADVRIRRAGLDVDPGWVPWLGRVVSFHYTRGD